MSTPSNVEYIKREYEENDLCMYEVIRYYIHFFGSLTLEEIRELIEWADDNEYFTAEQIFEECS